MFAHLISIDTATPKGVFGLFGNYDNQRNEIEYSIMAVSDQDLPHGYSEFHVPNVTWAIFDCRGLVPQAIQMGWQYLNEEWLIKYPSKHAAYPELEWYSNGNAYDSNYLSKIWTPIIEE